MCSLSVSHFTFTQSLVQIAKQEEWEEKNKLGFLSLPFVRESYIDSQAIANQFRALEEDEIQFLDSIRERQEAEERQRKQEEGEEVKQFKQCVPPLSSYFYSHRIAYL